MKDFNDFIFSGSLNEEAEFIPLMTSEDEEQMNSEVTPDALPILPLRNTVLFPGVVIPITVGRDKSIKLIQDANKGNRTIGVVSQKDDRIEDPEIGELNEVGTMAYIIKMLRMPDGNTTVIIQGKKRIKILEEVTNDPYITAKVKSFPQQPPPINKKFDALVGSIKDMALKIIDNSPHIPSEASFAIKNIESASFMINFIASNMSAEVSEKQRLLEEPEIEQRAVMLLEHITKEMQLLELKNDIQTKVRVDLDKQQKEYFLHQQMKQIQEELGGTPQDEEIKDFLKRAKKMKWAKPVKERFEKEVEKLQRMNTASAEYSVQSNYVEALLDLPWDKYTEDKFDLKRARKILDRDHYGLEKVKERIIEHLAVLKLKGDMKSPILCLYGPPGVGKTSLGKSVAEAMSRNYVRMSLGGLRDEAEIRGHRKTYIGAMMGRILQNIKKAKTSNPIFVLDEIDKIGNDFHGDPSSALLEVLDPEQNNAFYDNFIELDYDLSKVMFIATANSLNTIQPALLDRMEIIEINGYTVEEKVQIAIKHLIPKLLKDHGLKKTEVNIGKKIIENICVNYTRESGVRNLEKQLAKVIRNVAKSIVMDEAYSVVIQEEDLTKILGPAHAKDKYEDSGVAGVVTGLAWTRTGGDILFIEASVSKGKGQLTLTGNLGDVMKESAVLALEYIKTHADAFGIDTNIFRNYNVHIHVPEGATPKDGPSAGITMFTALVSAFTQRKVRSKIAMTGEITLRGTVLPVGGIKEKILAAKRADIKEIILSMKNKKDVDDIDQQYLKGLKFHYVENMSEIIDLAILKEKVKNPLKIG